MQLEFRFQAHIEVEFNKRRGMSNEDALELAGEKLLDEVEEFIKSRLQGKVINLELM